MYIVKANYENRQVDLSLREMLKSFLNDNDITPYAISEGTGIGRATLTGFLEGTSELKFMHAVRLMKVLGLTDEQLISAYSKDFDSSSEEPLLDRLEQLSYITKKFDIPALKKIGIIKPRAKIEEYGPCICSFFGFSSIYEYDDTSLLPTLFSKSARRVNEEKEAKMTEFWLKCAIRSFFKIGNPNEYDKGLLIQLLKRSAEFTSDEVNGYYRFVYVLFQIGVTVLTQSYTSGTKAHGSTMIISGKPCIIITDMGKQYHKLWLSLLHELHHVINDFEMLETLNYHFSTPDEPDLLLNEQKANQFALDILINPAIRSNLSKIIPFPYKVIALSKELGVSPSIVYGVYLESLPNGKMKGQMFAKYSLFLLSSDITTKNVIFDPVGKKSLDVAIERMREVLYKKVV